ncbi:MAG: TauD/TfdA dioxygenase family protein [Burkholderiales bacterium]
MAITITELCATFAAEVSKINISKELSDEAVDELRTAIDKYGVLVFRDQPLSDEQQVRFSEYFGDIEIADLKNNITKTSERRLSQMFSDISNLDKDQNILEKDGRQRLFNLGNRIWHSDSSFRPVPARYSLLSARAVPVAGGDTQYADMHAAYDSLDAKTLTEISDLQCEHSLLYSRARLGMAEFTEQEKADFTPVTQPLVRTHPSTKRKSLFLSSHIGSVIGLTKPDGRLLIEELTEFATQEKFVYTHRWKKDDLVMWDNRRTMHRARKYEDTVEKRDLRRTTIAGEPAR